MAVGFRDTHLSSPVYTDPEAFDPSRWDSLPNLEKQEGDCSIDRMNYTPFGAGVRFCVGKEYAKLIIRIFLIELARKCDWKLLNPYPKILYIPVPRAEDRLPMTICKRWCQTGRPEKALVSRQITLNRGSVFDTVDDHVRIAKPFQINRWNSGEDPRLTTGKRVTRIF